MNEKEIQDLFATHSLTWEDFSNWASGQTVTIVDDRPFFYIRDIIRFCDERGYTLVNNQYIYMVIKKD